MDFMSRTQSPPNSASTTGTKRTRLFLPLSNHGMPRTPMPTSPGGSVKSHRFHKGGQSPRSPRSPGSPPMSARTFATFFSSSSSQPNDSPREPYSPQAPSQFSGSTLAGSPESTPSLPPIPQFEKVQFEKAQLEKVPLFDNIDAVHAKRRSRSTPNSPISEPGTVNIDAKLPPAEKKKAVPKVIEKDESEKENEKRNELETSSTTAKATDAPAVDAKVTQDDQSGGGFTKFSRKILAVLSSKSAEKAEAKRRSKEAAQKDLDRLENVHWTDL